MIKNIAHLNLMIFTFGASIQLLIILILNYESEGKKKEQKKYTSKLLTNLFFTGIFVFILLIDGSFTFTLYSFLSTYILCFLFVAIFQFSEYILPRINEMLILIWNIVFWYLFIQTFQISYVDMFKSYFIVIFLILPTLVSLYIVFTHIKINKVVSILLYLWFMTVASLALFMMAPFKEILTLYDTPGIVPPTIQLAEIGEKRFRLFFLGMTTFYVVSYIGYIFYLIPLPAKHQTMKERLLNIKKHLNLLGSRFTTYQFSLRTNLLISLITIGIITINHIAQVINQMLLLSMILSFAPFLSYLIEKRNIRLVK